MAGSLKFDTWLNDDDTENYKCRAFVNFNGTGTVAIRASGNVGSITDNGTGDYTINFAAAMPDANYSFVGTGRSTATNAVWIAGSSALAQTTSSLRVQVTRWNGSAVIADDTIQISVAIFR